MQLLFRVRRLFPNYWVCYCIFAYYVCFEQMVSGLFEKPGGEFCNRNEEVNWDLMILKIPYPKLEKREYASVWSTVINE